MMHQIDNFLGLVGVFVILVAYVLLQLDKIKSTGLTYGVLNLLGTILILVSLYDKPNLPAILMEVAWAAISIYSLIKLKIKNPGAKA
jgi:hypothetical protein